MPVVSVRPYPVTIFSNPSRSHLDHFDRDGSRPGDSESQRRQVEGVEVGVIEDRLVDGRRPRSIETRSTECGP